MGSHQTVRECGTCTTCCEGWVNIEVNGTAIYAGHPCSNITPKGCAIYDSRPDVCKGFDCAWLKNEMDLPEWMKPDNSNVIIQRLHNVNVFTAIPVGKKISGRAMALLKEIAERHSFVLLYHERTKEKGAFTKAIKTMNHTPSGCAGELSKLKQIMDKIG